MSDNVETHSVHQLIVPAYVWHDDEQRKAACVAIGDAMRRNSEATGEQIDIASAVVTPQGLRAVVSHVRLNGVEAEPVGFVGYDACAVEQADLVMISVDAVVVQS